MYQASQHCLKLHYYDVIMGTMASLITSLTSVYSTVYSDADQRKHQSSASLAFVWGIHRGPVNSPHKWPVTRKMLPFDDVIMHRDRVTYICISKLTIIGSDNGLSSGRYQAIIWSNCGILLIGPLRKKFIEILIEIPTFSFKKIHLKMSSGTWRPFCLGLNMLTMGIFCS